MIDHLAFDVADFAASRAFYAAALAPLGIGVTHEGEGWALFGDGRPLLAIAAARAGAPAGAPMHLAFQAIERTAVERFHRAALAAGGRDNGAPGLRPHYHPHYWAAFVIDPDGHNLEAVCHAPGTAADQKGAGTS